MNLSNIPLYVKSNTDNIQIESVNMYCFLHPSIVSYSIPSFMKKYHTSNELTFSYVQM